MADTKYTTNLFQGKLKLKNITLVPQPNAKSVGWKVCQRIVNHPQSQPLSGVFSKIKNYAVCVPCNQVVKYNASPGTLLDHVQSIAYKVYPKVKAKFPKTPSKERKKGPANDHPSKKLKQWDLNKYVNRAKKLAQPMLEQIESDKVAKFRENMLPHLGVVNEDLRSFNFSEGKGIQKRDPAIKKCIKFRGLSHIPRSRPRDYHLTSTSPRSCPRKFLFWPRPRRSCSHRGRDFFEVNLTTSEIPVQKSSSHKASYKKTYIVPTQHAFLQLITIRQNNMKLELDRILGWALFSIQKVEETFYSDHCDQLGKTFKGFSFGVGCKRAAKHDGSVTRRWNIKE